MLDVSAERPTVRLHDGVIDVVGVADAEDMLDAVDGDDRGFDRANNGHSRLLLWQTGRREPVGVCRTDRPTISAQADVLSWSNRNAVSMTLSPPVRHEAYQPRRPSGRLFAVLNRCGMYSTANDPTLSTIT